MRVAGVAVLATIITRVADSLLEAQALAGILVSAVLIDLLVSRVGGELPNDESFAQRLRAAVPFALPGLAVAALVVATALALGHARIASVSFDPASFALGLARAFGSVARRQLPFVVLPLALLARRVDPRALVVFGGVAAAATALQRGDTPLSVFVHLAAGLLGAAAILRSKDFLAGLLAEGTVYFTLGTLCTSVLDVRMGVWALTPIERLAGPYALALSIALVLVAVLVFPRRERSAPVT